MENQQETKKLPLIPRWNLSVKFGWIDLELGKRIYFADTHEDAVKFVESLQTWGMIESHDCGRIYKITI